MGSRLPRQAACSYRCSSRIHCLSSPFLLLSFLFPTVSFAQLTASSDAGVPASSATPPLSQTLSTISTTGSGSPTTFTSAHASTLSTLTSAASQIATGSGAQSAGTDASDDDGPTTRNTSLLNYYFVFLALFGILLFAGVYFLHQRKKRLKARFHSSGQTALARDLDGWTSSRRWMHGNRRGGNGGNTQAREEGLNELGEAPPPYKPRAETLEAAEEGQASGPDLTVPLEAFTRDGRATLKPPDYDETVRASSIAESDDHTISRPSTAARLDSRPTTAAVSTTESHTDLVTPNSGNSR